MDKQALASSLKIERGRRFFSTPMLRKNVENTSKNKQ